MTRLRRWTIWRSVSACSSTVPDYSGSTLTRRVPVEADPSSILCLSATLRKFCVTLTLSKELNGYPKPHRRRN